MKFRSAWIVFMLATIWVATPSTASAQVGVLVGLNMANVNFEATGASGPTVTGDHRTGFVAGLSFNMPLQDMFSVEVDALFAQSRGGRPLRPERHRVHLFRFWSD